MYEDYGLFINGVWVKAQDAATTPVINPATEETLGVVPTAHSADTRAAVEAAAAAFPRWKESGGWARADLLHKIADVMTARREEAERQMVLESGKPLAQAVREWNLSIDQFRWFAEEARRLYGRIVESRAPGGRIEVHHQPVGIVGIFTAWNFPAVLLARKIAPALAAGCTLVARPSQAVPGVAMVLFDCLRQAGLPAGVANLVIGTTENTYQPMMEDVRLRKISLTGSTRIGQQMLVDGARTLKRASMELGGNAPLIVFADTDREKTLDLAVATKFANAGQVCVCPNRIYVQRSLYESFLQGFVARVQQLKLGNGLSPETTMGPLIHAGRLEAMEKIVDNARSLGVRILAGGKRAKNPSRGFFFEPTVLADVPDEALALREEIFGPIAAITPFDSEEEVFTRANACELGLASYVFTRDPALQRRAVEVLESGMVGVNSFALAAAEAPFGGIKASGMGYEGGAEGIAEYCNVKLAQMTLG